MRIEYGEIEANLLAHPSVRYAAAIVHGASADTQRLIAYFEAVSADNVSPSVLRTFLASRLPEYTVPTAFIRLDRMPLLPSGKVDRVALPQPATAQLQQHRSRVGPRNSNEERLDAIWREVLNVDLISIDDNFFDRGGHSLSAMRVINRVRRDFHIDLPIRSLFDNPTIEGLAKEIENMQLSADASGQISPAAFKLSNTSALLSTRREELRALSPNQVEAFLQSVGADQSAKIKKE